MVDVRVIATNRDLREYVRENGFARICTIG